MSENSLLYPLSSLPPSTLPPPLSPSLPLPPHFLSSLPPPSPSLPPSLPLYPIVHELEELQDKHSTRPDVFDDVEEEHNIDILTAEISQVILNYM